MESNRALVNPSRTGQCDMTENRKQLTGWRIELKGITMFVNVPLRVSALRISLSIVLVSMLLGAGAFYFTPARADATACSAYVNDSSYGNSGGYAYSHAVAYCDGYVYTTLYATIVDGSGYWLGSGAVTDYATYFTDTFSGYFCATLAPGYYLDYDQSGGNLYPLWTC